MASKQREAKYAGFYCGFKEPSYSGTLNPESELPCTKITYRDFRRAVHILKKKGFIFLVSDEKGYLFGDGGVILEEPLLTVHHPTEKGLARMAKSLGLPAPKL